LAPKITKLCFGFEIVWCQNIVKKSAQKILMKITMHRSLCGNNFFDGKYLNTEVFKGVSANDVTQTLEN